MVARYEGQGGREGDFSLDVVKNPMVSQQASDEDRAAGRYLVVGQQQQFGCPASSCMRARLSSCAYDSVLSTMRICRAEKRDRSPWRKERFDHSSSHASCSHERLPQKSTDAGGRKKLARPGLKVTLFCMCTTPRWTRPGAHPRAVSLPAIHLCTFFFSLPNCSMA